MSWNEFAALLQMGQHGAYVWGSVAALAIMIGAELAALALHDRDNRERTETLAAGASR